MKQVLLILTENNFILIRIAEYLIKLILNK